MFKQEPRRLPRAETYEIGTVGGTHCRQHERQPVGILLKFILLFLRRRIGFPIADHRQFRKLRNTKFDKVGSLAQHVADDDLLRRSRAGADLLHAVAHPHLAVSIKFQRQRAGIRTRAVILLYLREADAVPLAGIGLIKIGLGFLTVHPQRMLCRKIEHFNIVQLAQRLGSLRVFKARLQCIAAAELDLVHTQLNGEFVDHQLRDAHGLKGAVTAHRPRFDCGCRKRDGRKIGFR